MKQLLIILIFLLSEAAFCQDKNIHLPLDNKNDSTYLSKYLKKLSQQIELDKIQCSTNNYNFRLWTQNQVIEVWVTPEGDLKGKITCWTSEKVPYDEEPTNRVFYKIYKMDSIQLGDIFKMIDSSKIHQVPDESLIKGWVQGCDGIMYIIETANSTDYSIKTYWTPSVQDSLKEAKIVQDFVDGVKEISGAGILWNQFVKEVPFECSSEGIIVWCKVLSKGEKRKYRKEREAYRQQQVALPPTNRF